MPHFIDRAKPGVIAVTRNGKRFTNEGNSYHDFVQAMVKAAKQGEEISAYAAVRPPRLAQLWPRLRCAVPDADRPSPQDRLSQARRHDRRTGREHRHRPARAPGHDRRVQRPSRERPRSGIRQGRAAYNRYQGDGLHGPNPCVAPIEDGPFYAIKLVVGDLGTYAGIRTDEKTRALDAHGQPIKGLYAVGNDMASIMGGNYPGAGITLGPALTFGYIAGKHIAGEAAP